MQIENLLRHESRRCQRDGQAVDPMIAKPLKRGQSATDLPEQVGQENEERHQGRQPQPAIQQESALRGKQQAHQNAKAEEEHRMLVFKAESSQNSEQYPPLGMVVLN